MTCDVNDISLADVVDALRVLEVPAFVDHTGGGTATLFAGPPNKESEGRWTVAVGPGWFAEDRSPWASTVDLYVGPDDDGEAAIEGVTTVPAGTSATRIAELVTDTVKLITADPRPTGFGAACDKCGGTFNPSSLRLVHDEAQDGSACGGLGRLIGSWR